ncbi:TonB-dependent receptor [Sphingosinicella soli]|uniref:Outer membrane receptor protein involved in Fe transport n=1 Tax=Sphingosinicella soli TaxID=333708 RepID=A0A7W7F855_9SPHN|nr:TonB-dependent receptor [Sphingosinicella soli]MBB4633379.1 outer membrane receptor protein involved in Fe transport [Sphingosinicella soli]
MPMIKNKRREGVSHIALIVLMMTGVQAAPAAAQASATTDTDSQIADIIVTAQKRSERLSDIGMSITAATGEQLKTSGIRSIDDFARVDTSFSFGLSQSGTPTYTIRGVGYYDFALSAPPTVSAYVDQVPLAYSALTKGVTLDLERVEVLKGPQGTLFGQNSTGGAMNFIAAKPTSTLQAGIEASIGRFTAINVNGFISGPLTETLKARLAFNADAGGAWQKSYTRKDTLGDRRFQNVRLLLDWAPAERLSVSINLNGWRDRSDTQAGQLTGFPRPVALTNPTQNVPVDVQNAILNYPLAPRNARAADWGPADPRADEDFRQAAARIDYEISDQVTLTSVSSYSHYIRDSVFDIDGLALSNNTTSLDGKSRSFSQELRLSGKVLDTRLDWVIGGSYASDKTTDIQFVDLSVSSPSYSFVGVGAPHWNVIKNQSKSDVDTKALFGNLSYKLTGTLTAHGGVRYTHSSTDFEGCTFDTGDGLWAAGINAFQFVVKNFVLPNATPFVPVLPGGCATFDAGFTPGLVVDQLKQDNISWRAGLDWKVTPDTLFYANVSKGYKAGAFPTSALLSAVAAAPVVQESVVAYEAGVKAYLLDRSLQIDAAYFHYDYRNKQVNGVVPEPVIFGALFGLINVPKSKVDGFELSTRWRVAQGLTLRGAVTYLDTRVIGDFINVDRIGSTANFKGESFPYSPKWSAQAGANYEWPVSEAASAYVGADYSYRSGTRNNFGNLSFERIRGYGLLDLRAGLRSADDSWSAEIWGRNVTNSYYWTDATYVTDTSYRRTGMPVTYGLRIGYRFR